MKIVSMLKNYYVNSILIIDYLCLIRGDACFWQIISLLLATQPDLLGTEKQI